jgi:HEPN domain-containing protein
MRADLLIANTLRIAKEDLDAARLLAPHGNRNATYLCEQAAEKIILAVLTSEGKHGGIKHRLDEMVSLVPDENPLKTALRDIECLAAYATTYRYATPRIPSGLTAEALSDQMAKVESALNKVAERFGVDLLASNKPATTPGPIR